MRTIKQHCKEFLLPLLLLDFFHERGLVDIPSVPGHLAMWAPRSID